MEDLSDSLDKSLMSLNCDESSASDDSHENKCTDTFVEGMELKNTASENIAESEIHNRGTKRKATELTGEPTQETLNIDSCRNILVLIGKKCFFVENNIMDAEWFKSLLLVNRDLTKTKNFMFDVKLKWVIYSLKEKVCDTILAGIDLTAQNTIRENFMQLEHTDFNNYTDDHINMIKSAIYNSLIARGYPRHVPPAEILKDLIFHTLKIIKILNELDCKVNLLKKCNYHLIRLLKYKIQTPSFDQYSSEYNFVFEGLIEGIRKLQEAIQNSTEDASSVCDMTWLHNFCYYIEWYKKKLQENMMILKHKIGQFIMKYNEVESNQNLCCNLMKSYFQQRAKDFSSAADEIETAIKNKKIECEVLNDIVKLFKSDMEKTKTTYNTMRATFSENSLNKKDEELLTEGNSYLTSPSSENILLELTFTINQLNHLEKIHGEVQSVGRILQTLYYMQQCEHNKSKNSSLSSEEGSSSQTSDNRESSNVPFFKNVIGEAWKYYVLCRFKCVINGHDTNEQNKMIIKGIGSNMSWLLKVIREQRSNIILALLSLKASIESLKSVNNMPRDQYNTSNCQVRLRFACCALSFALLALVKFA